jgi:tetratricopeptide (TPR) repeat protein
MKAISRLHKFLPGLAAFFLLASSGWFLWARAAPQSAHAPADLEEARHGLDLLMNGQPDAALEIFQRVEANDPQSPLGDLLTADALWWKIYFATGNLTNPEVFDVASEQTTPYDAEFNQRVNAVLRKAQARIRAGQDVARNELYLGMGYALQARLLGMRGEDLATARAGKQMRAALLAALAKDPQLNDAYLGVGIYNYFVDTLPAIVKLIRWLIGLPGGSREAGLQQIERAATKGDLSRGEAAFYLAKDYSRDYEKQYSRSLQLFQQLEQEYPDNDLWKLLAGNLEVRLGRAAAGEALYRQVLKDSQGSKSEAGRAFNRAAKKVLLQLHPNEKFRD